MDRKKKQKKIYNNAKDKLSDKLSQSSVAEDKEKTEFQPGGFQKETKPLKKKKQQNKLEYGAGYNNAKDGLSDKLSQSSVTENKEKTEFQPGSFQKETKPLKKKKQKNRWQQDVNYNNTPYKPPDNLSGGFSLPLDKELLQSNDSSFMDTNSGVKTANSRIKKSRAMKYFKEMHQEAEKPDTDKFMQ